MYLTQLRIQNLRLIKDLQLSFTEGGKPRMWTVIIGENGTGKTSILQAIAMAAAGHREVNGLVENKSSLRDKRPDAEATVAISADFMLDQRSCGVRNYPGLAHRPTTDLRLNSRVELAPRQMSIEASSRYCDLNTTIDPIDKARGSDEPLWFVAAYGINRFLPMDTSARPKLEHPSIDRLRPLFGRQELIGTNFANLIGDGKSTLFTNVLERTLFGHDGLLPGFRGIELRGGGGVKNAKSLQERHLFIQTSPSGELKIAAGWLSHGYQSTIAWVADLVGHILLESGATKTTPAAEMEGLVLIDELDLYLHPRWQRTLIRALKATFPRIQFIVTTHSPLVLVGVRPDEDEIVRLVIDPRTGDVQRLDMKHGRAHEPDPRLMTGSEIYRSYFGIDEAFPGKLGETLRKHRFLAANPARSREDDALLDSLEGTLRAEGVEPDFPRVTRTGRTA